MVEFDAASCFEQYLALVANEPKLFENPSGDVYEILLDPIQVRHAQDAARGYRLANDLPAQDTRVGLLADDPYVRVMRDAVRFPDGTYGLYNRLLVPGGVAMLPVFEDKIALIHRFRHGTRTWHLEAPRGSTTGCADFVADAQRELLEETGTTASNLTDLGMLHSSTGCLDEAHRLYLARLPRIGQPEKHEAITEIRLFSVREMEAMIAAGEITDGPTLAIFLRARLRSYI
jgi:ADP-ribose pyrophosphatase